MKRRAPRSTLFPYTTLFRSDERQQGLSAFLYLTTTGRRTGLPREIEIWFTERGGYYYVIAEHRERADWVRNIQTDPRVRRSEEHTSELQSLTNLVCRLLLEK